MDEILNKGGPLMWLLLASSVVAFGVFAERWFFYHRARTDVADLLRGLRNLIQKKNYSEASSECKSTPGPVARVARAALAGRAAPREELRHIVQEAGQLEVPRLERHLSVLGAIVQVAPLVGLLGTLIGLLRTFLTVTATNGFVTPVDIAGGVYESLVSSAAGLAVAIPAYLGHTYLRSCARRLVHDMERVGIELIGIICLARESDDIVEFDPSKVAKVADPGKLGSVSKATGDS